jgi:hypothetical protein
MLNELSWFPNSGPIGPDDIFHKEGTLYMFVYSIISRRSLNFIIECPQRILMWANRQTYPMCIVGNHSNWAAHRLIRYEEVAELARRCTCPHREVSVWKPRSIEDAFIRLVRAGWAFEREKEAERVKLEREFEEQQKNLALLDALAVPDENSVGLPQPTGMDSSVHPLLRDEERLRPGRPGLLGIVEETGGN